MPLPKKQKHHNDKFGLIRIIDSLSPNFFYDPTTFYHLFYPSMSPEKSKIFLRISHLKILNPNPPLLVWVRAKKFWLT